jgi:regulatory protein NPR1
VINRSVLSSSSSSSSQKDGVGNKLRKLWGHATLSLI